MCAADCTEKLGLEGLLKETFLKRTVCPVPGCSAGFSVVQSFRDHLSNHDMPSQRITETVEKIHDRLKHTNELVLKSKSVHTGLVREAQGPTKMSCFANASIQFLRKCELDTFLNGLERIPGNKYEVCDSLLTLLTCQITTTTELREIIAKEYGVQWKSTWNGADWVAPQQCSFEFITFLFQMIRRETQTDINDFENAFQLFKERSFIDGETEGPCSNCNSYPVSMTSTEDFVHLNLVGHEDNVDLNTLLDEQLKVSKIDMKCSTCCPHESGCPLTGVCALKPAMERATPMLKKYLFVMIKRFITHDSPKILTKIKVPHEILLNGVQFETVASLEHIGNELGSGHFIAYTKVEDHIWLKHDDETSSVCKLSEVGKDAYLVMLRQTGTPVSSGNIAAAIGEQSLTDDVETRKSTSKKKSVPLMRAQEPAGSQSQCPRCRDSFTRRYSVRKHLEKVHKLNRSEVEKCMKKVKTCLEYCSACFQFTSNLSVHRKKCRGADKQPQTEKRKREIRIASKGLELLKCYRLWLENASYNSRTTNQYVNILKNSIIPFWERNVDNFLADGLLHPLDCNTAFPPITSYIKETTNNSNILLACKAYLGLLSFLRERFEEIYSGDSRHQEKLTWRADLAANEALARQRMKRTASTVKVAAQMTASQKIQSGTDLAYNQTRMKVVMADIINSENINSFLRQFAEHEDEDDSNRYDELYLRNFLAFLVFFYSAGKRGDAIANLTVGALNRAQWDGSAWTVRVDRHKTMKDYGSAIVIMLPTLYKCVKKYVRLFHALGGAEDTDLVFRTKNNTAIRMWEVIEHSKELVLEFVTEEEFKSFGSKAIRKGWINLADGHPDPRIRELAVKLQDHSEKTRRSHYSQTQNKDMVNTVQGLVSQLRRDGEHEEELSVPVVEQEESAKNNESSDRANTVRKRSLIKQRRDAILTDWDKCYLRHMLTDYPSAEFLQKHKEDSTFMEIWNRVYDRKKKGGAKNPLKAAKTCIDAVRRDGLKKSAKKIKPSKGDTFEDELCDDESSEAEKDSESDKEDMTPRKVLTPGCYKSDSEEDVVEKKRGKLDSLRQEWSDESSSSFDSDN